MARCIWDRPKSSFFIKMVGMKNQFLIAALCLICSQPVFAKSSSSSIKLDASIWIPVRFSVYGGYQSSQNNFEADKKDYELVGPTVGMDFSIPMPPIRFTLGATGWIVFGEDNANEFNGFYLVAPFIGYSHKTFEILIGPAFATLQNRQKEPVVTPNHQVENRADMSCGFLGLRKYLSGGVTLGIGINGYYCKGESYDKETTDATLVKTKAQVSSEASSWGGNINLLFSWGEQRKLH